MQKRTKIIAGVVAGVLIIGGAIGTYFLLQPKEEPVQEIKTIKKIQAKIFSDYVDLEYSKDDIALISDEKIAYYDDIPFLKEGFYQEKLTDEEKNGEDLSAYEEAQDKYIQDLLKEVKNNLEYEITKEEDTVTAEVDGKEVAITREQTVILKSYLLWEYNMDFQAVYNSILDAHYGVSEVAKTVEDMSEADQATYKVNAYKAKVKTMQIMNNELKRYRNKDLTKEVKLYYVNVSETKKAEWRVVNSLEIYNVLSGIGYEGMDKVDSGERIRAVFGNSYNSFVIIDDYLSLSKPDKKDLPSTEVEENLDGVNEEEKPAAETTESDSDEAAESTKE